MKKIACALLACCALFGILPESIAQNVAPGGSDLILVRPTEKSPEAVVEAIKAYAEGKSHWFGQDKKMNKFVLDRIKAEGPLQSKDFEFERNGPGN